MADESNPILDIVDTKRKRAETKALDISLNELADMYKSGELIIRPEFQRLFRWPEEKQSQFIESLLLEFYLATQLAYFNSCLLYTSPSPRDKRQSRMPSSA